MNGGRYNSTSWDAGLRARTTRICGTAATPLGDDERPGEHPALEQQPVLDRQRLEQHVAVGHGHRDDGVEHPGADEPARRRRHVHGDVVALDSGAIQSPNTVRTFIYDTSGPTTAAGNLATTNKDGGVEVGDTFAVTFNEALNPASVPLTAGGSTLTLSKRLPLAARRTGASAG